MDLTYLKYFIVLVIVAYGAVLALDACRREARAMCRCRKEGER